MLYSEFLEGTGGIDCPANFAEYRLVKAIYMNSAAMTKKDAYRMARVFSQADAKRLKKDADIWKRRSCPDVAWVISDHGVSFQFCDALWPYYVDNHIEAWARPGVGTENAVMNLETGEIITNAKRIRCHVFDPFKPYRMLD